MKWADGSQVRIFHWGGIHTLYEGRTLQTDKPTHKHAIFSYLFNRGGRPQPAYDKHCTLALWNPRTAMFHWIAIDCDENIPVMQLVCVVGFNHWHPSQGALHIYIGDYLYAREGYAFSRSSIGSAKGVYSCKEKSLNIDNLVDGTLELRQTDNHYIASKIVTILGERCIPARYPLQGRGNMYIVHEAPILTGNESQIGRWFDLSPNICPVNTVTFGELCVRLSNCNPCKQVVVHTQSDVNPNVNILITFLERSPEYNVILRQGTSQNSYKGEHPSMTDQFTLDIVIEERHNVDSSCFGSAFTCTDRSCVLDDYILDGQDDCLDGSDEQLSMFPCLSPDAVNKSAICDTNYFKCQMDEYVQWKLTCNGIPDCTNGLDESKCVKPVTINDENDFICYQSNFLSIPIELVDDLIPDCHASEDEPHLLHNDTQLVNHGQESDVCLAQGLLACKPGHPRCFPIQGLCQFDIDQRNRPKYCRNFAHLENCEEFRCPQKFKCPGSYCIAIKLLCNADNDCPNGEDENERLCKKDTSICPGYFRCKNGSCLSLDNVCDGTVDCDIYGDDERYCNNPPPYLGCVRRAMVLTCHSNTLSDVDLKVPLVFDLFDVKMLSIRMAIAVMPQLLSPNSLFVLIITHTKLEYIRTDVYKGLIQLLELYVTSNVNLTIIQDNAFSGLASLWKLNLSNNAKLHQCQPLSFNSLTALEELDISNSHIEKLEKNVFKGLISLKHLNLTSTKIYHLNFETFSNILSLQIILNYVDTLVEISIADRMAGWDNFTIITDSASVCCIVGAKTHCIAPTVSKSGCQSQLELGFIAFIGSTSVLCIILSIVCIIARIAKPISDKLMHGAILINHIFEMCRAVPVLMAILKDILLINGTIKQLERYRYIWCSLAAAIQLTSVFGQYMLIAYLSYVFYSGLDKGTYRSKRITITHRVLLVIVLSMPGVVWFSLFNQSLTPTCSYIWTDSRVLTTWEFSCFLIYISAWPLHLIVMLAFYIRANSLIRKSAKDVGKFAGTQMKSKQSNQLIAFCQKTVLIPTLSSIIPVVSIIMMLVGYQMNSIAQVILSINNPSGNKRAKLYMVFVPFM